jgi:hypothetical protein
VLRLFGSCVQDECEGELAVAMPLLESALAALNTLTKADITEVRKTLRVRLLGVAGVTFQSLHLFWNTCHLYAGYHQHMAGCCHKFDLVWVLRVQMQVRSMKNPPAPVKITMEAVCQLLGVRPKKVSLALTIAGTLRHPCGPLPACCVTLRAAV